MEPTAQVALEIARQAGRYILQASEKSSRIQIAEKTEFDFVTNIDLAAEAIIVEKLKETYPQDSILAEESGLQLGKNKDSERVWIIDPIDGTTNFIHGIPQVAVSIALQEKGKLTHGVVYNPFTEDTFIASRGRGATMNNRRIRVSEQTKLATSLIGTGFPFNANSADRLKDYLPMFEEVALKTAGIRRFGSASLDLCYLAAGQFDGFWEIGLNQWDFAAGALILREAGGMISDFSGGENWMKSGNIVAGNPKIFKQLLPIIRHQWIKNHPSE